LVGTLLIGFNDVCMVRLVFSSVLVSDLHCYRGCTDPTLLPHLHLQVLLPQEEVKGFQEGSEGRR